MNSFGRFLRDKRNQQVLGWLGGGLVVATTGLWGVFVYFFPSAPETKASHTDPANVQADCGGVAVGGNVSGATITTNAPINSDCASKRK